MSIAARFRNWLASPEFAAHLTAILVALAAGILAFQYRPHSLAGYFLVFLAGIAVPGIYDEQWSVDYDQRLPAAVWALFASLSLVAAYLVVWTLLQQVVDQTAAEVGAFVTSWLVGFAGARGISGFETEA
jgi:UDP-N-acetylmuramyl pentapeptide phosphotransferase/UDP-N-acetylglucosamine-1-phosphate transferase